MPLSRLHALSPDGQPLFTLTAGDLSYNDSELLEVIVTRGNASPFPDIAPSTIEARVHGAPNIVRNSPMRLELSPWFRSVLAGYGPYSGTQLAPRFDGRKGITSVEDHAWVTGTQGKWFSTVSGSSWTTLLRTARRTTSAWTGNNVVNILAEAYRHPAVEASQPTAAAPSAFFDTVHVSDVDMSFGDAASRYGSDLHIYASHQRSGRIFLQPPTYRAQLLNDRAKTEWPLLRAQGISPARWSSGYEAANVQFEVKRRAVDSGTGEVVSLWPLPEGVTPLMLETESLDLLQVNPVTENFRLIANARTREANLSRMELESVTVDLVHLLSSPKIVHRRLAVQLLALEAGDPIYLSGDWPPAIRAPYFANQIKERITPDTWEIELTLFHPRDVLGLSDSDLPAVQPRVWDSVTETYWNAATGTWNDYA